MISLVDVLSGATPCVARSSLLRLFTHTTHPPSFLDDTAAAVVAATAQVAAELIGVLRSHVEHEFSKRHSPNTLEVRVNKTGDW